MQLVFSLQKGNPFSSFLTRQNGFAEGELEIRTFPDREIYVRVLSGVKNKKTIIVSGLEHPDEKLLQLYFLAGALKAEGAQSVTLISPFLPYLRHDKVFNGGEAFTAALFARLISSFVDAVITIDPHLHRITSLESIYSIPVLLLTAAPLIGKWINENIQNPLIIGPDSESEQWVQPVAAICNAPYIIPEKVRHDANNVSTMIPDTDQHKGRNPVIIDDIISTGQSMANIVRYLQSNGFSKPVCIGIHALFSGNAFEQLRVTGTDVITCNTISHPSNRISLEKLLLQIGAEC